MKNVNEFITHLSILFNHNLKDESLINSFLVYYLVTLKKIKWVYLSGLAQIAISTIKSKFV